MGIERPLHRTVLLDLTGVLSVLLIPATGLAVTNASLVQDTDPRSEPVDFHEEVKPILVKHCFECHGADEKKREADLRLDTKEAMFAELDADLFLVKAGDVEQSYMMERIVAKDDFDRMPPEDFGPRLTPV